MTSKEVMLINYGLAIQKFKRLEQEAESDGARYIAQTQITHYETKYFETWYEINRDKLENKYIADMIEQGHEIQDIETMLQGTKFVERAMEKCFISLS